MSYILSFSGPSGFCLVNEAELLKSRIGLCQSAWLGLSNIIVEGDSSCAICWALGSGRLADVVEEVLELELMLNVPFVHIKGSANKVAVGLVKEGVGRPDLVIEIFAS